MNQSLNHELTLTLSIIGEVIYEGGYPNTAVSLKESGSQKQDVTETTRRFLMYITESKIFPFQQDKCPEITFV